MSQTLGVTLTSSNLAFVLHTGLTQLRLTVEIREISARTALVSQTLGVRSLELLPGNARIAVRKR